MIFGQSFCQFGCDFFNAPPVSGKVVRHQSKMLSHKIYKPEEWAI